MSEQQPEYINNERGYRYEPALNGNVLQFVRDALQKHLVYRFGPLPEDVKQRIATANWDPVNRAFGAVYEIKSLDELQL
jgi:hypothetical protein